MIGSGCTLVVVVIVHRYGNYGMRRRSGCDSCNATATVANDNITACVTDYLRDAGGGGGNWRSRRRY